MIKETIEKNAEVKVNSKEMEVLQKHFPSCFDKDGKFDIKVFEELIKTEDVDIKKEGYSLDFLGKSYARYLASLDSETVIVPDEGNKDINSENIYIVGDNLDALQHLKYSYSERIKCIYIDPPYNTGSDGFVYNDKFEFTAEDLAKKIGIEQEEAERVLNMQGKSTHSAWLTFMYPRLELARDLLSEDGAILISCDDNEQSNCKLLCDIVFGEGNLVGQFIWRKKDGGGQASDYFAIEHEYILVYRKSEKMFWRDIEVARSEKEYNREDKKGKFKITKLAKWGNTARREDRPSMYFPIMNNEGIPVYPIAPDGNDGRWRVGKETMQNLIDNDLIHWEKNIPYEKEYYQEQLKKIKIRSILYKLANTGDGSNELTELFGEKDIFENPKPSILIQTIIDNLTEEQDVILDFFSGSASTAHATFKLSLDKPLKWIMVQLDEQCKKDKPAYKAGYKTIDEIGRERIRRAAKKIAEENPKKAESLDLGFKTYYLKATDKATLDKIVDFDPNMPLDAEDIKSQFGKDAIIETWKIKDGYGFNANVKEIDLKGYTAYFLTDSKVGTSLYLIDDMPDNAIVELVRKIEAYELNVDRIIEYGYAFGHGTNTALRSNLKTLKNRNAIEPIIRY